MGCPLAGIRAGGIKILNQRLLKKPVKLLFSLFDLTGNQSEPYRKAGWIVEQVDIQLGTDLLKYDYKK
jgi:hypothetical protein